MYVLIYIVFLKIKFIIINIGLFGSYRIYLCILFNNFEIKLCIGNILRK